MAKRGLVLAVVGGLLLQSCILYFFRDTDLLALLRYTGSGPEGIGGPLANGDSYLPTGGSWQLVGIPGFSFGDTPFGGALQAGADGYLCFEASIPVLRP